MQIGLNKLAHNKSIARNEDIVDTAFRKVYQSLLIFVIRRQR